jgi:hypothetical protein
MALRGRRLTTSAGSAEVSRLSALADQGPVSEPLPLRSFTFDALGIHSPM